jgi:hypothetical protein
LPPTRTCIGKAAIVVVRRISDDLQIMRSVRALGGSDFVGVVATGARRAVVSQSRLRAPIAVARSGNARSADGRPCALAFSRPCARGDLAARKIVGDRSRRSSSPATAKVSLALAWPRRQPRAAP